MRKAHSMFDWDWGPQLVDAGIWRPIYIEGTASVGIEDVRIRQVHEKDGSVRVKTTITLSGNEIESNCTKWSTFSGAKTESDCTNQSTSSGSETESDCTNQENLAVPSFDTRSSMQAGIAVTVALAEKEGIEISKVPAKAVASRLVYEAEITVQHPKLWWPNGYGEPPLYELAVSVDLNGGQIQCVTKTIGLRTLTVSQEADAWGNEFAFFVNGVKIFTKGANYIPEDAVYPWIDEKRIDYLLQCCVRAHFNCVRVWGGGYYPSDAFYDLCDRYGLIVWQDLMYACNVYDVTDDFAATVRQETLDNVRRLRHHASLGLWCGNNEIESAWHHWGDFQKESMYLRAAFV